MTLQDKIVVLIRENGRTYGLDLASRLGIDLHKTYPLLWDLERKGVVISYEEPAADPAARGGRPIRWYALAEKTP